MAAGTAMVLALALLAAPGAQAARSEFYGITQPRALSVPDLYGIAGAKVHSDRFPLQWSHVEPSMSSALRWSDYDLLIGELAAAGIRSAPFVWGSPGWAGTGGWSRPPDSSPSRAAWEAFLKAAVARYGRGGSFWGTPYHRRFGPQATALPITSWQIWNEPNLKYAYPATTYTQKAARYGQLVKLSHDAITAKDSKARVVLAGITTQKDPHAFDFLSSLYSVRHIKDNFSAAAQHPYASSNALIKTAIERFRSVMANHGDEATPLWITEFAWGSHPPDSAGVNRGLNGQATALTNSYKMLLANRTAWNLQRVYWFLWRDPPGAPYSPDGCSFCSSAGLVRSDGTSKPALSAFKSFTRNPPP